MKIDTCILVISLILFTVISAFFKKIQNPTLECGTIAWDLAYGISLSIVASIIFYWVTVHIPEQKKKKDLSEFIKMRSLNIAGDAEAIFAELNKKTNSAHSFETVTLQEIENMCNTLPLYGDGPMVFGVTPLKYATWIFFLYSQAQRSKGFIDELFKYIIYLESEHVQLLTEMNSNSYFMTLEMRYRLMPIAVSDPKNPTESLTFFSKSLYGYFQNAKKLKQYTNDNFKNKTMTIK